MIAFTLIIPFHLNQASSDRIPMMQDLLHSIPDRPDLEVLWVDDHSALSWKPEIPTTATHHIVLQTPSTQRFAGPARNFGMNQARGRWIFFADNDDLFDTNVLNDLLDTILAQEKKAPRALYIGPFLSFHVNGTQGTRHTYSNTLIERAQGQQENGWLAYHYSPCAKIADKFTIQENNLHFGPWLSGEDAHFSAPLALLAPKILYYKTPFYHVREGHESITTTVNPDTIKGSFAAHFYVQRLLRKHKKQHLERPPIGHIKTFLPQKPIMVSLILTKALFSGDLLLSPKAIFYKIRKTLLRR